MKILKDPDSGAAIDATSGMYPSRLRVQRGAAQVGSLTSTTYGFVLDGQATVACPGFELRLESGGYFAAPEPCELGGNGTVVLIERLGFRGLHAAGRIEAGGRLAYIDGCSDTILVCPPRAGDPVLNHLHFPPGIVQSVHSHPSVRLGVVARGRGAAFGPNADGAAWEHPLSRGAVFLLEPHEIHAFKTSAGEAMDVIAYHPDSDWGPSDAAHPMLNRTYLAARARG